MINTKAILGISLAAIFAVVMIAPQVSANGFTITPLEETEVKDNKNTFQKITFSLEEEVKLNGEDFGGFAVFTENGDVIAATTHGPIFYDSEAQIAPTSDEVLADPPILPGPAVICTGEGEACGPEYHIHLVKPVGTSLCAIAAVGNATFEEPSATVVANQDNIKIINVKKGTSTYTDAVTGELMDFTVGSSAVNNPVNGELGIGFPLNPVFSNPEDPSTLQAICIGPPAGE